MYCLLILPWLGLMFTYPAPVVGWLRAPWPHRRRAGHPGSRDRGRTAGGRRCCALALFATVGASWSANRYMPTTDIGVEDMGLDAYRAHFIQQQDGKCPKYAGSKGCSPINKELAEYTFGPDDFKLFCGNASSPSGRSCADGSGPGRADPARLGPGAVHTASGPIGFPGDGCGSTVQVARLSADAARLPSGGPEASPTYSSSYCRRGSAGADVRESSGKRLRGLDPGTRRVHALAEVQAANPLIQGNSGSDFLRRERDTPDRVGRTATTRGATGPVHPANPAA